MRNVTPLNGNQPGTQNFLYNSIKCFNNINFTVVTAVIGGLQSWIYCWRTDTGLGYKFNTSYLYTPDLQTLLWPFLAQVQKHQPKWIWCYFLFFLFF